MPRQTWTVTGVALLAAAFLLPPSCASAPEISPTVFVGGIQDLLPDATGASKCSRLVDGVVSYGAFSRVQVLVSQRWWDSGPRDPPPGWDGCDDYTPSTYYCYSRFNATDILYWSYRIDPVTSIAIPVTEPQISEFSELLALCLEHAIGHGLDIAVNVHADDGRQLNGWRNTLDFDPLQPAGGFSFYDIMLAPIADALNRVLRDNSDAWLSLQGEMGATIFLHPRHWVEVAHMVRERLSLGRPGLADRVKLGLGINNNKLCGCVLIDAENYDSYLADFALIWPLIQGWFDLPGIQAVFDAVDYVGISAYVPQSSTEFQPCDMESKMVKMDVEFSYFNLSLAKLEFEMGKEIHWIEWGLGAGASNKGDTPARNALEASYWPYWGIFGPYNPSRDPWQNPEVRGYMRHYVRQTSRYLLQGGCRYRINAVYLWSTGGSWDIIGLANPVYEEQGSFRDEAAVQIIRAHNVLARGRASGAAVEDAAALGDPMALAEATAVAEAGAVEEVAAAAAVQEAEQAGNQNLAADQIACPVSGAGCVQLLPLPAAVTAPPPVLAADYQSNPVVASAG